MGETVRVRINDQEVDVEKGSSLLAASMKAGIRHMHLCGGRALCTTCRVQVLGGPENLSGMETLERVSLRGHLSFSVDVRLACQAKVLGPVEVKTILPTIGTLGYKDRR